MTKQEWCVQQLNTRRKAAATNQLAKEAGNREGEVIGYAPARRGRGAWLKLRLCNGIITDTYVRYPSNVS